MQILAHIPTANEETEVHLSQVLNTVNESINVFEGLNRPVEHWDDILIYFAESKLPPETRKDWAKEIERKDLPEFPKFEQLRNFLEARLETLDGVDIEKETAQFIAGSSANATVEKGNKGGKKHFNSKKGSSASVNVATQKRGQSKASAKCSFCQGDHFLSYCPNFLHCSQEERRAHVASAGLCFNCLKTGHKQGACTSKNRCFVCGESHHTKLHGVTSSTDPSPAGSSASPETTSAHAALSRSPRPASMGASRVLLSTACVILQAPSGLRVTVRALLDSGAEESFISERVSQALSLKGFSALVLRKLTAALPSEFTTLPAWPELKGLKLADPDSCAPKRVDCILNSEAYAAALRPGIRRGPGGSLVALHSAFGWVLMGSTGSSPAREEGTAAFHTTVDQTLSEAVSRFWELEEIPSKPLLTPDEHECYKHFKDTHRRAEDGRFEVRMPFANPPVLEDTRLIAERCLLRLERRLQRNPTLAKAYSQFMDEYRDLNHLEIVPDDEINRRSVYYLPHHPVIKNDGSGKIRVVFNASQCDSAGNSLNTFLHTGPKLQEDMPVVVICWQFLRVAFSCDIVKMFRQYRLFRGDMDWLRILWRFTQGGPIQTARLSTVTYGTGCASFLANACLLQLAEDEAKRYPRGAQLLRKGRYVDDFFAGADDLEEATLVKNELTAVLATAGMSVDKWAANRTELLLSSKGVAAVNVPHEQADTVSILGLCWEPTEDVFRFRIKEIPASDVITKRIILSTVARLFDPISWLTPFIIRPKVLLQDLWMRGVDWDAPVPIDLHNAWLQFKGQIPQLETIKIPRWFGAVTSSSWHLHAFCDASERAYAAALYIVLKTDEGTVSRLITAKSKVAPLKIVSLPRLELCGAGLLASLVDYLLPKMPKKPDEIHCWSDSKVALAWISAHPSRWKTFIANRVSDIHEKLPGAKWRHVRSADNPSDLATRGLSPEQLRGAEIWWKGPAWLCEPESAWPIGDGALAETNLEARQARVHCAVSLAGAAELTLWLSKFSSFQKLTRIVAYMFRWKLNAGLPATDRRKRWLTAGELELGRRAIFKVVQAQAYGTEIAEWMKKGCVPHSSPAICRLTPFLDRHRVLRVGGRLHNSSLAEAEKHPVVLPTKDHVVALIIKETHLFTLHGGPSLVQSVLSRRYWIVRGRNFVRRVVRQCVRCARMRADTLEQQMGPLPAVRTAPSRTFATAGVDFAGPFLIKASGGRGQKCFKGYVAVFVCMVTSAVHLEVVSDYTTAAFLAAFRRFAGRRGTPSVMLSDNGTNFKGADAELKRLFAEASAVSQEVAEELARDGVEWRYIPPRAPNFGGLWEASVKAFKYHFKRVVAEEKFTFEEFTTLTTSIEACLNSRPLGAQNCSEEDDTVLTPGHFLIGAALTAPPEPFEEINDDRSLCSRWKRVSLMRNHFWKRWHREYLSQMQQKAKWLKPARNFKVGDIVLFKDTLLPPTKWPLARIVKLYFGADNLSRVAVIRTASAEYKRPINKLILLPVNDAVSDRD